ncbi:MAG TPA: GNAT family N-acetyltransferase [Candidatus Binatia bacterium]|nr:GNAT family N-acetyltransferase [Candidatus Binatia bacterium]
MEVVPVQTAKDLDRFIRYVYDRYRNEPHWVPPLPSDEKARLTPGKNPYFEHAEAAYFLALEGGRIVGRIAATVDRNHDAFQGERQAAFGFFEAESPAATASLLAAAERWGRAKGAQVLRGPLSFTTNDECGLLIDGFDHRPMLLMPYNVREYAAWIEAAGLTKAKDLYQWRVPVPETPQPVFQRIASMAKKRDRITVRPLDMKKFNEELGRVKTVYNAAWERNWGFVPMTDAEIDHMASQLKPAVVPDLVQFAEVDGAPVGFGLILPDVNVALAKVKGKLFPFGLVKLLWTLPRIKEGRLLALGVLGEYQKRGVGALLVEALMRATRRRGYPLCEVGWTLEDNDSVHQLILGSGGTRSAVYRIYEKRLA